MLRLSKQADGGVGSRVEAEPTWEGSWFSGKGMSTWNLENCLLFVKGYLLYPANSHLSLP